MARDYTKYNVDGLGENLNKRKLVFTIVKDWIEKNNPSLEELQTAFPDELQGKRGVVRKESEVKDPKRFNMKEPLSIKNGMHVVVCNQWGENILDFIGASENLGYSIEKVELEKSNITKSSSQYLSVDIELRSDNQELICSIKNFNVNIEDSEIKNMYDSLLDNFCSGDFTTLTNYHLFEKFEREIYHEFSTNSHPSCDEYITIDDMKQDDFDWWGICPHLVVTRIGEIDLNPIVNLDEDDEDMLNKCCSMLNIDESDRDDWEDYISDYFMDSRFSVTEDLFKEVNEELYA
jgi:hypothetical protein